MPTALQAQERVVFTPFHIDETGSVAYATSAEQLAVQEIEAILLTAQRERVMRPTVGSPFPAQTFATLTSNDTAFVVNEMLSVLVNNCRYSTIQNLSVDMTQLGVFSVSVFYTPISFNVVLVTDIPFTSIFSTG